MNVRFLTKKNIDIKNRGKQHSGAILRREKNPSSVLFSRGKRSNEFFTEDSKLYITPREQKMLRSGVKIDRNIKKWDSLSSRIVENFARLQPSRINKLLELWNKHSAMLKENSKTLRERSEILNDSFTEVSQNFVRQFSRQFSLVRVWNMSIIGSVLFGMVIMTFVYRYLGQGASAEQLHQVAAAEQQTSEPGKVLGAEDNTNDATTFTKQVLEIEQVANQQALEKEIAALELEKNNGDIAETIIALSNQSKKSK